MKSGMLEWLRTASESFTTVSGVFCNAAPGALLVGVFLLGVSLYAERKNRALALVFLVLGVLFIAATPVVAASNGIERAFLLLAFIPAAVIVNHALLLYFVRRRALPHDSPSNRAAVERAVGIAHVDEVFEQALGAGQRHFSPEVIALRYGPPAIGVFVVALAYVNLIAGIDATGAGEPWLPRRPAALGFAGAYLYVTLQLGRRSFQSDITPGTAMWCLFTLLAGPVLAGTASILVTSSEGSGGKIGGTVLYFAAGFSPRMVVSLLVAAAKRIYLGAGSGGVSAARTIPLSAVRGIGSEIEERLGEEGIYDAHTLASADPIRLLRNTPFDKRMIASFIDNALLISRIPESRDAFEKIGVRGASDLAWYGSQWARAGTAAGSMASLAKVAEMVRIDLPVLTDVCVRLWEDAQVRLVWLLYQVEGDGMRGRGRIADEDLIQVISTLEHQSAEDPDRRERQQAVLARAVEAMGTADTDELRRELDRAARAYEGVRSAMPSGTKRTQEVSRLVARARVIGRALGVTAPAIAERFRKGTEGDRIVALVLARDQPDAQLLPIVRDAIAKSKSAFEQYHALSAARELRPMVAGDGLAQLRQVIREQMGPGGYIQASTDRSLIAQALLDDAVAPASLKRNSDVANGVPLSANGSTPPAPGRS